ncbi:MAG: hypothetical protein KGM24_03645 [Elusimicrobia bacterium]|nr:hypothetical protein [Elusimicrobiota bacterium]
MKIAAAVPVVGALALLLGAAAPQPARRDLPNSFLPPNSMRIEVDAMGAGGITHAQFDAVMDQMQAVYGPIIAARGGQLVINRLWDDPTVNASAERNGDQYVLNMYGGLARHPAITQDGMMLVACHEMGHHLGGAPKFSGGDWASDEGEADYFATSKCLHRMFADTATRVFTRSSDDNAVARKACDASYKSRSDRAICYRTAMAGMSVTALFTDLGGDPAAHFDTPDTSVVAQTDDSHPASQCRLDTYFQGALCTKSWKIDMDDNDPAVGACVASQGYTVGLRPRCWYKPPAGELRSEAVASRAPLRTDASPSAALSSLKGGRAFVGL